MFIRCRNLPRSTSDFCKDLHHYTPAFGCPVFILEGIVVLLVSEAPLYRLEESRGWVRAGVVPRGCVAAPLLCGLELRACGARVVQFRSLNDQ